jgi:hypothetical protein
MHVTSVDNPLRESSYSNITADLRDRFEEFKSRRQRCCRTSGAEQGPLRPDWSQLALLHGMADLELHPPGMQPAVDRAGPHP